MQCSIVFLNSSTSIARALVGTANPINRGPLFRRGMNRHGSIHAIATYEANYMNAASYSVAFSNASNALRSEYLKENKDPDAQNLYVWCMRSNR